MIKKIIILSLIVLSFQSEYSFANTGWYIAPYKTKQVKQKTIRYCAVDDYTILINSDGGLWSETEILGNMAIVKVSASASTLSTLNGVFIRIPANTLNTSLSSLTNNQRNNLKSLILSLGYTAQEIQDQLPNDLGTYTLKDVLKFMATRRLRPRYDSQTDSIILDGPVQSVRPIEEVDGDVQ